MASGRNRWWSSADDDEGERALLSTDLGPGARLPQGCGFSLRPLRPTDAARFAEALNDAAIRYWMHGVPDPYTEADALRALSQQRNSRVEGLDPDDPYWAWAMVDRADQLVGKIALSDRKGAEVSLAYWLHPEGRGRGWMRQAVRAVTAWALASSSGLAVSGVRANVATANHASRSVLERTGFVVAEAHRGYRMGDGTCAPGLHYRLSSDLPSQSVTSNG